MGYYNETWLEAGNQHDESLNDSCRRTDVGQQGRPDWGRERITDRVHQRVAFFADGL